MTKLSFEMGGHHYSAVVRTVPTIASERLTRAWFVSVDGMPEVRACPVQPDDEDRYFSLRGRLVAAAHRWDQQRSSSARPAKRPLVTIR